MTTLADNGLHIRPRVHNWSTTITIRAHNHTHRSPNFQSSSPALAAPIIGRTGLAEPRPGWVGRLCLARGRRSRCAFCAWLVRVSDTSSTRLYKCSIFSAINEIHLKYQCTKRFVLPQWNVNAITIYCIRRSAEI